MSNESMNSPDMWDTLGLTDTPTSQSTKAPTQAEIETVSSESIKEERPASISPPTISPMQIPFWTLSAGQSSYCCLPLLKDGNRLYVPQQGDESLFAQLPTEMTLLVLPARSALIRTGTTSSASQPMVQGESTETSLRKAKARAYYLKNKEKLLAYNKERRQKLKASAA